MDIPHEVKIDFDSKTLALLFRRREAKKAFDRDGTDDNAIELHRIEEQLFERLGRAVLRITERAAIPSGN